MGKKIDLTGQKFGRLVVLEEAGRRNKQVAWRCQCDCGNTIIAHSSNLRRRITQSCGCLRAEMTKERFIKHGKSKTPEHHIWCGMRNRCQNPDNKRYKNYGGRGIKVCERWMKFENFYADMGPKPSPEHSIDRIDNNGDYEPRNCRWVTIEKQANNKANNRKITFRGKTQSIAQWAREININYGTLYRRIILAEWPIERALGGIQ